MTELSELELKELSKFGKKKLTENQLNDMEAINEATRSLMEVIFRHSPRCADQSAAIRSASLTARQANAAVVWDSESE